MKTGYTLPNGTKIYDTNGVYFGSLLSTGYWDGGRPNKYHYFYAYQNNGYFMNWAYDSSSGLSPHYAKSGSVYGWDGGPNANYKGTIGTFEFFTVGSSIHTVGYGSDGGTVTGTGNFTSGSTATINAKAKTGYILTLLDGYSGTLPTKNEVSVTMRDDTTVNAYFQKCYDITFNLNGGKLNGSTSASSLTMYNLYYNSDNSTPGTNLPRDIPTKEGYSFGGWSINGRTYQAGAAIHDIGSSNSYTATAVWVRHTVSFAGLNGATPSTIAAIGGGVGDVVQLPSYNAATKPGYSIGAWTIGTTDYAPGANYTITNSDVTATAKWVSVKLRKRGTGDDAAVNVDEVGNLVVTSSEDGFDIPISLTETTETVTISGASQTRKAWLFAPKPNVTYRVSCEMTSDAPDKLWSFASPADIAVGSSLANVVTSCNFTRKTLKTILTSTEAEVNSLRPGEMVATLSVTTPSAPDSEGKYITGQRVVATANYPDGMMGWKVKGARLEQLRQNGANWEVISSTDISNVIEGDEIALNADWFTSDIRIVGIFGRIDCSITANVDSPSRHALSGFDVKKLDPSDPEQTNWIHASTAKYGETVRIYATVGSGFSFDGFYVNGVKVASAIPSDGYVEYQVQGDSAIVAKAKVHVSFGVKHWLVDDEEWTDGPCTVIVNGESIAASGIDVTLGETISYVVSLSGAWIFDAWFNRAAVEQGTPDFNNPLDFPVENAAFAPTEALDIVARVVDRIVPYETTIEFVNDEGETHIDAQEDFAASLPEADDVSLSGGDLVLTYSSGTKSVRITLAESIGSGSSALYFVKLQESVYPSGWRDLTETNEISVLTNKNRSLRAVYGSHGDRTVSVAYADGSDRTDGEIGIVESTAQDGRTITAARGSMITLRAIPNNGRRFGGWFYNSNHIGSPVYPGSEVSVEIKTSRTIYAYFYPDTHAIYEWEGRNVNKMMTWRSKVYVSPRPFNPSAIRVDAEDSRGRGTSVARVEVGMMSSPDGAPTAVTVLDNMTNYKVRRLPFRRSERYLQVEVRNDAEVDRILVGTSMEGLAV